MHSEWNTYNAWCLNGVVCMHRPTMYGLSWCDKSELLLGWGVQFCNLIATLLIGVVTVTFLHAFCPGDILTYFSYCLSSHCFYGECRAFKYL